MFTKLKRHLKTAATVSSATALEGLQQPVCFLLAFTCIELTVIQPMIQLHTLGEAGRLTRDGGLAFMLVFGILIAVFTSGFTLSKEIAGGTASAAISKPVSRNIFLLGKFLGALFVILLFAYCQTLGILFAERSSERYVETAKFAGYVRDVRCGVAALIAPVLALAAAAFVNWWKRRRFGLWFFVFLVLLQTVLFVVFGLLSIEGSWNGLTAYDPAMDFRILPAAFLIMLLLMIFAAIATALSTRLQTGPAVAAAFIALFLGFLADTMFGGGGAAVQVVYAIVPDVQHFWVADSLGGGGTIPKQYVARAAAYALTYVAFVLTLGALSFKTRDLG